MNDPRMKVPGPDHPITIAPHRGRVTVRVRGRVIADSEHALVLQEAALGPVLYIPRADIDMTQLETSAHETYCPYKGVASYFSVPAGGERSYNAAWSYEAPYPAVGAIAGHVAFYPDRVDEVVTL